jgi:hypothetical protein
VATVDAARTNREVVAYQLAITVGEVVDEYLTRQLFAGMLRRIAMLPSPAG